MPLKAADSKVAIYAPPVPNDPIYFCSRCQRMFDTLDDAKHHFRFSPSHTDAFFPPLTGDEEYDQDIAAREMVTVLEVVPEQRARKIKRQADRNGRVGFLAHRAVAVVPKLEDRKRKIAPAVAVAPVKKGRVSHIDYEDNRNIQNVLVDASPQNMVPEALPIFNAEIPYGQDSTVSYKDNRNIQNVFCRR